MRRKEDSIMDEKKLKELGGKIALQESRSEERRRRADLEKRSTVVFPQEKTSIKKIFDASGQESLCVFVDKLIKKYDEEKPNQKELGDLEKRNKRIELINLAHEIFSFMRQFREK